MSCVPSLSQRQFAKFFLIILSFAGIAMPSIQGALVLNYNPGQNLGWFDNSNTQWGETPPTYNSNWVSGSSAVISPTANLPLSLTNSTNVTHLTFDSTATITVTGETSVRVLQMSGGNLSVTNNSGGTIFGARAVIQGSYIFTTNGWLRFNNSASQAYVGTATVQTGRIHYTHPANQIGSSSNFVITGGEVAMERSGADMGTLTLNSGAFILGRDGTNEHTFTITTSRLEGNGATARIQTIGNSPTPSLHTFVANQSDNTTYAGRILGTPATAGHSNRLIFQKDGVGDLTLTGELDLRRTSTVFDGRLYINSTNTSFQDEIGSTAISVTGGVLGGTGTISLGLNDNVIVGANGALAAGVEGVAGVTTYELNGGSLNLSAATASANTGWLRFDLGGLSNPGSDYDQILLTGGSLNLGTGLNFSAFDFNLLSGFGVGTYVLFETDTAIVGSLGMHTGILGGYDASLSIVGNNLVLSVIPEPSSVALLLVGVAVFGLLRHHRQKA
jgi:hypothetical protein